MGDNLQVIVDEMRAELSHGNGGYWAIRHDKLAQPLYFEVVPDGITCLVFAECGERRLMWGEAIARDALLSELYVLLRRLIRLLTEPAPKPS